MDIVLSFVLNMKNQAQYSANILYIMFIIVLGEVVFLITTACLPAREKVLFLKVFLYCVLKMEACVFVWCKPFCFCSTMEKGISNKPNV